MLAALTTAFRSRVSVLELTSIKLVEHRLLGKLTWHVQQ